MSRRYRTVPLSDHAVAAYHRQHYAWSKQEFSDRLLDVYEMCHSDGVPFLAIIQPRRFCTLEVDLDPAGFSMNEIAQAVLTLWCDNAVDLSEAPKKSKSVAVSATGVVVRGLDLDMAQQLADRIWRFLASTEKEVSA